MSVVADGNTKTASAKKEREVGDKSVFQLPALDFRQATLMCVQVTPLIINAMSAKSAGNIEGPALGAAPKQKGKREPDQEWKDACHYIPGKEHLPDWEPGKYCLPASMFKHAFMYGVGQLEDQKRFPKTRATGWMFPDADPVLQFASVDLRKDVTRNPVKMTYRPQFNDWWVELDIGYNANAITLEQVVTILDLGGFTGGIGEWRPSAPKNKSGSYGRFRVKSVVER